MNSAAKKYLITIMVVFVITMVGIVVATNVLDKKNGDENGVFSWDNLKSSFRVDKKTIAEQRQSVTEPGKSSFLADVDTSVVEDGNQGSKSNKIGEDTEFFHASILSEKDIQTRENSGITKESIELICKENVGKYCYDTMDESLHQLYAEILIATKKRLSDVPLCSREQKEVDMAYRCVLNDHPEIFTVCGYVCVVHSANNSPVKTVYSAKYTMSAQEEAAAKVKIDEYTAAFMLGVPKNAGEYDKVKYTYEYLINNTEYVLNSAENQNICSVMIFHQSVCLGYAKSMQYLLDKLEVPCTVVEGYASNGDPHAWNLVRINQAYYFVDVTWGDSSYTNGNSAVRLYSGVNYEYLNITSDELTKGHQIDNVVPMPRCVEIADNYYVKEGLYFDQYNSQKLSDRFKEAQNRGEDHITIKCANDSAFQEVKSYLLDEQKVFDFLPGETQSLSYSENPDMHTLTFLLK